MHQLFRITSTVLATSLSLAAFAQNSGGPLYINELLASNQTGAQDEEGQTEDWIELYNASGVPISLAGYTISDDPDRPDKWPFPAEASVPAGGYLIVWADEDQEDGPLHANFKLARGGESVALFDASGAQVDAVVFPELPEDQAYARREDGASEFVIQAPTFSAPNDGSSSVPGATPYSGFRAWPSVLDGGQPELTAFFPAGVDAVTLVNALGQVLWAEDIGPGERGVEGPLSLPALSPGPYYLVVSGHAGSRSVPLTIQ